MRYKIHQITNKLLTAFQTTFAPRSPRRRNNPALQFDQDDLVFGPSPVKPSGSKGLRHKVSFVDDDLFFRESPAPTTPPPEIQAEGRAVTRDYDRGMRAEGSEDEMDTAGDSGHVMSAGKYCII